MGWALPAGIMALLVALLLPVDTGPGTEKHMLLIDFIKWTIKKLKR